MTICCCLVTFLEVNKEYVVAEAIIPEDCPLTGSVGVEPLLIVELVMQTAGVCNGLTRVKVEGEDCSKFGFLVGVKRANFLVDTIFFASRVVIRAERYEFDLLLEVSCFVHHVVSVSCYLKPDFTSSQDRQKTAFSRCAPEASLTSS